MSTPPCPDTPPTPPTPPSPVTPPSPLFSTPGPLFTQDDISRLLTPYTSLQSIFSKFNASLADSDSLTTDGTDARRSLFTTTTLILVQLTIATTDVNTILSKLSCNRNTLAIPPRKIKLLVERLSQGYNAMAEELRNFVAEVGGEVKGRAAVEGGPGGNGGDEKGIKYPPEGGREKKKKKVGKSKTSGLEKIKKKDSELAAGLMKLWELWADEQRVVEFEYGRVQCEVDEQLSSEMEMYEWGCEFEHE